MLLRGGLVGGCIVLAVAGCSKSSTGVDAAGPTSVETSAPAAVEPGPVAECGPARFLSTELPTGSYEWDWEPFEDVAGMAAASDVVFVGNIGGTVAHVYDDGPDAEDPAGAVIEYDGIVFQVEEVLRPAVDPRGPDGGLVLAHPAALTGPDLETQRLEVRPIEVLEDGLADLCRGVQARRYLLFANELEEGLLVINTPGGVVEVLPDGLLGEGATAPFQSSGAARHGLTLEAARDQVGAAGYDVGRGRWARRGRRGLSSPPLPTALFIGGHPPSPEGRFPERTDVAGARSQRRRRPVLLGRVGEPAGHAGDREDAFAGRRAHVEEADQHAERKVDVGRRQGALAGPAQDVLAHVQGDRAGADRSEAVEQLDGAGVAGAVDRVAEAGEVLVAAEPRGQGPVGAGLLGLDQQLLDGDGHRAVPGAGHRAQPGAHDRGGVGPERGRDAGGEGRAGQLVVGQQDQGRVEHRDLVAEGPAPGQSAPEPARQRLAARRGIADGG